MIDNVNYLTTAMIREDDLKQYYLNFIDFLLQQKQVLIDIGTHYELTPMQTLALLLLDKPLPMSSLTAILGCDASNVTGIADGLQHKKLVQRVENPDDRRMRMLVLSNTGVRLRDTLFEDLINKIDPNPIFGKLNQSELKTFFRLIDKVTQ